MKFELIKAYAACILRSLIYGSSILFTGRLLASADTFDVLSIRFLLGAIVFGVLALCGVIKLNYKGKNIRLLLLTAFLEPVGYFILESYGIKNTSTSTAGVIFAFMPVVILIAAKLVLKETATKMQNAFILCRILGTVMYVLSSSQGGKDNISGIMFLFASIIVDSFFVVFLRKSTKEFSSFEITFAMLIEGAVAFNIINIFIHTYNGTLSDYFKPLFDIDMIIGFLFLAIISSIVASTLVNYASARLPAPVMTATSGLTTLTTVLCGVLFNKETLNIWQVIGLVIILLSVIIVGVIQSLQMKDRKANNMVTSISS